jgi:hypothetical protein
MPRQLACHTDTALALHPPVLCAALSCMQTGVEIFIVVDRISLYYCITAILPIWLNTCLSLLVRCCP